jgi:hypothetical protein
MRATAGVDGEDEKAGRTCDLRHDQHNNIERGGQSGQDQFACAN